VPDIDPVEPNTPAGFPVQFGRYVLLGVLGEGGMARVYRAELRGPSEFRKAVAVKVVRPGLASEDERLHESLLREARIGGLLKHPNIVDIYDFGEVGKQAWIAMELIEGTDLATWLEHFGPPPPPVVLEIGIAICSGLADAHELSEDGRPANLIHRDLKPSNVLVSRKGEVKVMDFGIAKASGIVDGTTCTGMVRGTPRYLSPEQALAEPLDPRSDLFAVGLLLYELALGEPFFDQTTVTAVVASLLEVEARITVPSRLDSLEECIPGLPAVVVACTGTRTSDSPTPASCGAPSKPCRRTWGPAATRSGRTSPHGPNSSGPLPTRPGPHRPWPARRRGRVREGSDSRSPRWCW